MRSRRTDGELVLRRRLMDDGLVFEESEDVMLQRAEINATPAEAPRRQTATS